MKFQPTKIQSSNGSQVYDPNQIANAGVVVQGGGATFQSSDTDRRYIYFSSTALNKASGKNIIELYSNKSGKSVVLDNVSIAFGDTNRLNNADFGFYIGETDSILDFGVETKLIAKGSEFYGVYSQNALGMQGKLVIEGGNASKIVGARFWSLYKSSSQQALELQIDAKDKNVVGIHAGGNINADIKITKFIANQNSYVFQNDKEIGVATLNGSIYVGDIFSTQQDVGVCAICSNLDGARYGFYQSDDYEDYQTEMVAQTNSKNYFGIGAWQNLSLSGNIEVRGNDASSGEKVKNVAGIYIGKYNSDQPLTIKIEDNTNFIIRGHKEGETSGVALGLIINNQDANLEIERDKKFALRFLKDGGKSTKYVGFYVKDATLKSLSSEDQQNIIFDTYRKSYESYSKYSSVFVLDNGALEGTYDFCISGNNPSFVFSFYTTYGIVALNQSTINSRIIFRDGFFQDKIPQHLVTSVIKLIDNRGNLTLESKALFFSESFNNQLDTRLISNTGSIIFQSGAKAIFGQEYAKLSEITQDGIYLAKNIGKISTSSMTFRGNSGISVASGATLDMTLSSGTLEFNGSNGNQEMTAFNALQSGDPSVAQGKINLTINQLNSSIIFTKAQGGQLENFTSLVDNPISSASTDKNTIINLAGITQDNTLIREAGGKLATRSLTIKNANIKSVNFVAYVNPSISTNDVEIANFDGRAYSDSSGGKASNGASDRIIIEKNLGRSGNNILSIAVAPNQSTKNLSSYMLVGQVKTDSNITFNNLRNGDSQNITAYSGLRTTTLTLHRSDVGDYSYYYVTSVQDSTPSAPPSGGGGSGAGGGNSENDSNKTIIDVPNVGVAPLTRSAFKTNFTLISSTLNSLNKRLGDIRSLENIDGVWARVFMGQETFQDALQTDTFYTSVQAGYDRAIDLEGNTDFIGFALAWVGSDTSSQEDSYQVSPIDFINGKNTIKTNGVELALYNSYLSSLGLYTDSIIKFGYYSSDVSMPMMESFVLDDFSLSISQEVGYQAKLGEKKEWVITPQVEIAYAFISGSSATQNLLMAGVDDTMDISQSASHLLRMRAGVDWGYSFDGWSEIVSKADVYLGTSYEYDVISGGEMTYSLPNMGTYKEKGMDCNGRFVLNIGTNIYIKETASIYFDFEKSFGDTLYKEYQVNLGARFSFGEKIRVLQDERDKTAPLSISTSQSSEQNKE